MLFNSTILDKSYPALHIKNKHILNSISLVVCGIKPPARELLK